MYVMPLEFQLSRGRTGVSFIGLTLPYSCACPKPGTRFSTSYVVVGFFFQWVTVIGDCFFVVDIGGIDEHHCFNNCSSHILKWGFALAVIQTYLFSYIQKKIPWYPLYYYFMLTTFKIIYIRTIGAVVVVVVR